MRELWGADKLEAQLAAAKDDLRGLEKNIRKILGRDSQPDGENGSFQNQKQQQQQPSPRVPQKRPLQEDRRRQPQEFTNNGFPTKRRWSGGPNAEPKTVFSRLSARVSSTADDSGDEDDAGYRPAVSSRVIATPREIPSRQDVMRRESTDERSKQRNRRMFGALLGTLQKFRQEETKLKAKEDKKAEVEARVEEAKRKEKEELKRERQQLFLNRKQQLAQVKALETKLARSKQYQDWRSAQIPLLNFIKTKTNPPIYYLPKRSTPETDALIQESSKALKAEIDRREKMLIEELEEIEGRSTSGKNAQHNRSTSVSENQDQSMTEEPEEEENRDPNLDQDGDAVMADAPEEQTQITNHSEHSEGMNTAASDLDKNEVVKESETQIVRDDPVHREIQDEHEDYMHHDDPVDNLEREVVLTHADAPNERAEPENSSVNQELATVHDSHDVEETKPSEAANQNVKESDSESDSESSSSSDSESDKDDN
ncbi:hypothetical protein QAD02_001694 [Eretmocerus hayati]|uniref:Uncharacterized protein n=1 Tax=Eretmocerus hayati TaxID=131215 RepID=A0ACC2NGV0_9HYME|nr:hypothetical protein QAD02_001694 [Eretmocerus hayati]